MGETNVSGRINLTRDLIVWNKGDSRDSFRCDDMNLNRDKENVERENADHVVST